MSSTTDVVEAAAFDLFDLPAGYYADPDRYLSVLRRDAPVHRNSDGSVLVTRYADVQKVWRDPDTFVDKSEQFMNKFGPGPLLEHHTTAMLFRDPPDHDRLRSVVASFFTQDNIKGVTGVVQERVAVLIDQVAEREQFDFFTEFALGLPIMVICSMLGLPERDAAFLHDNGVQVMFALNPKVPDRVVAAGHEAAEHLCRYLADHLHHWGRRMDLRGDENVIAALAAGVRADQLSEHEALHMLILLMNGGHETTSNLLTVGLKALMDQRDQLDQLAESPELWPTAVEELIRFVSPIQLQGRRLGKATTLSNDEELPPGTEIVLSQASANRDEDVFERAGQLDVTRKPNRHLAFGRGTHTCIGQHLSRMEATIAFPAIINRFPMIHQNAEAEFVANARFRSLQTLPVSVA